MPHYPDRYYDFEESQRTHDTYAGILGYGRVTDDLGNTNYYVKLYPTDQFDAYDRFALLHYRDYGIEHVEFFPLPHTSYMDDAFKAIDPHHHAFICDIFAYLAGVPFYPEGVSVPERLLKEHARFGVDSRGQPLD